MGVRSHETNLAAAGCGLIEDPSPNEARLVIQGETGKEVRIIVSSKFVAAVNDARQTRVVIIESDTLVTTLPFEGRWAIEEEVFVDNRKQFDEGGPLLPEAPFRFVYTFNQTVTREIILL
jgi:hypothetical protein